MIDSMKENKDIVDWKQTNKHVYKNLKDAEEENQTEERIQCS